MKKQIVVVTGMGLVSPLGDDPGRFYDNLSAGESGIKEITAFDTSHLPCRHAAMIDDYQPPAVLGRFGKYVTRNTRMLIGACFGALEDAAYRDEANRGASPGMIVGSALGNYEKALRYIGRYAEGGYYGITPADAFDVGQNSAMNNAAIRFKARGIHKLIANGACSGLDALGSAYQYIRGGRAAVVLCGGHENLFKDMYHLLVAKKITAGAKGNRPALARPFDRRRCGMALGEAAAVLLLESLEHARARKARIYAEIAGFSSGFTPVSPWPGECPTMAGALEDAGLTAEDIDLVSASACGSPLLDGIEARAVGRLCAESRRPPAVTTLKGAMGECFGASGALQCMAAVMALDRGVVHPTLNCGDPLPGVAPYLVTGRSQERSLQVALIHNLDYFGFHSGLVVRKYRAAGSPGGRSG